MWYNYKPFDFYINFVYDVMLFLEFFYDKSSVIRTKELLLDISCKILTTYQKNFVNFVNSLIFG